MDIVRRYFTESWKIFTTYTTITDVYTDGHIPSVIYHWKYRQNYSIGIFPAGIVFFFCAHFSSIKPSVIYLFFTDKISDRTWNYWRTLCRRTFSIGKLVGKDFTDEVVILHRRNSSVSKTVKCCSVKELQW